MSNESNLPVYVVPGTAGTPDVYYLRSFSSLPDTEITKEQFDGITAATTAEPVSGSISQGDLIAAHGAQDPASPDFSGTPAVNATIGGTAAAPIAELPEQVASIQAGQDAVAAANGTQTSDAPADPPAVTGQPGEEPIVNTPPETNPESGVSATEQGNTPGDTQTETSTQPETTPEVLPGPIDPNVPVLGTTPSESTLEESGIVTSSSAVPNPNENSLVPDSSGSTSQTSTENPISSTSPVTDPTDPTIVAGEPLPTSVSQNPATVDPTTGTTPDLSTHPVDSSTLADPTIVQAPPVEVPVEDHASWFAKEKQRILDYLHGLEADVENFFDKKEANDTQSSSEPNLSTPAPNASNTGS